MFTPSFRGRLHAVNEDGDRVQLTDAQARIFGIIAASIITRGYAPTMREIGYAVGGASTNGVTDHLKALERRRLIARDRHLSRAIKLRVVNLSKTLMDFYYAGAFGKLRASDTEVILAAADRLTAPTHATNDNLEIVTTKGVRLRWVIGWPHKSEHA